MLENYTRPTPRTLTPAEVTRIKETALTFGATPKARFLGCRDLTIFTLALTVGLREHEIVALTIADAFDPEHRAREWILLRVFKGYRRSKVKAQEVFIPPQARAALDEFLRAKHAARERLAPDAPIFAGRAGKPLSTRQVRHSFGVWQARASLPRALNFHAIRHTACTAVYEQSRDLLATQSFARHRSVQTTTIYTHPSEGYVMNTIAGAAATWDAPAGRRWPARR